MTDIGSPSSSRAANRSLAWRRLGHHARALPNWVGHTLSNTWGILNVFDLVWLRPVPGALLDDAHPFVSGLDPRTGEVIWPSNVLFRSPADRDYPDTDDEIVVRVMNFLRLMVRRSSATADHPHGMPARMPPAINVIHGCVHYNGVSMLFNDFGDAVRHFTDPKFKREVGRFLKTEAREITVIFRTRSYERDDFAVFSCFMKTIFPYFGNPNGNRRRIQWGTPSPYPAFNLITGNWIRDTRKLLHAETRDQVARPPIRAAAYFGDPPYGGGWSDFLLPEKLLSRYTSWRIGLRGEKEGIYFVDARLLKKGYRFDPRNLPTLRQRLRQKLGYDTRRT